MKNKNNYFKHNLYFNNNFILLIYYNTIRHITTMKDKKRFDEAHSSRTSLTPVNTLSRNSFTMSPDTDFFEAKHLYFLSPPLSLKVKRQHS